MLFNTFWTLMFFRTMFLGFFEGVKLALRSGTGEAKPLVTKGPNDDAAVQAAYLDVKVPQRETEPVIDAIYFDPTTGEHVNKYGVPVD